MNAGPWARADTRTLNSGPLVSADARALLRNPRVPNRVWTTDRLGRLLAGTFVLVSMLIALLGPWPAWIGCAAAAMAGVQLLITSLVGWCPIQSLLNRLGAKEREEVFAETLRRMQDGRAEG